MNNILTTKTVFDSDKLTRGSAIHIREYMKNDTNHLIVDVDALIEEVDSYYISIMYLDNEKGIINKDIEVKDIENGNVEISFLKEIDNG